MAGTQDSLLRWRHPFYDDIQLQTMTGYNVLDEGKYGRTVLLERFMRIAQASKPHAADWVTSYLTALRCGELAICQEAGSRLADLAQTLNGTPAPLVHAGQVWATTPCCTPCNLSSFTGVGVTVNCTAALHHKA